MKKLLISVGVLVALVVGWIMIGMPFAPVGLATRLDVPGLMGRPETVTHDAAFYPGEDPETVVTAMVANRLFKGCGTAPIVCEGQQTIPRGTHVRAIKTMTLRNDLGINDSFTEIEINHLKGWVAADDVR